MQMLSIIKCNTVVSRVGAHGRMDIHVHVDRDFGLYGRLPRI